MKVPAQLTISIIGGGRAGASLSFYLSRKGFRIISLVEKDNRRREFLRDRLGWNFLASHPDPAILDRSHMIILTVSDDLLTQTARDLSQLPVSWQKKYIIHCSGTVPSVVLHPLEVKGALIACFHPIYSFSRDPRHNKYFNKTWYSLEAKPEIQQALKNIFSFAKTRILPVTAEQKTAVHLSCVFMSNFLVALASTSNDLFPRLKLKETEIYRILLPLLLSAAQQLVRGGARQAVTGPVKRADQKTILTHLNYLNAHHPDLLNFYISLSKKLITICELGEEDQQNLKELFDTFPSS